MIKATFLTLIATTLMVSATHEVTQSGRTFSVADLEVAIGDEVTFHNDDIITHNVFSMTEGHVFNLEEQTPGTSSTVTFQTAGDIEVRCAFHPDMRMLVHVRP